jgi:hypothetical protein
MAVGNLSSHGDGRAATDESQVRKHFFHTGDQFNDIVDGPLVFETTDRR